MKERLYKRMGVLFGVIFFLFPTSVVAQQAAYYVATSGCSDTNAGTLPQPFCTVPHGISMMHPGDTLYLRNGTYPNFEITQSGLAGSYLTIRAYNQERVSITGGASSIRLTGASYIHILGLDVSGANGSYGAGILIKNGANYNRIENNTIHDNMGAKTHGVIIDSGSHNTIINNTVYNNYSVGLKIQGTSTGNELIGNSVHDNVGDPPNSDGIAISGDQSTETLVQQNTVYNNGDDGIDTWSSHHHRIIGNISYNNGVGGGDGNGFKMGGTATGGHNTVIGNVSYNNKRDGFDSNHSGGNVYINNVAANNASVGFQDGEGKLAPCTPSTCQTTYINNIGYDNKGGNINSSEYTGTSHNNIWYSDDGNPHASYKGAAQSSLASLYAASGNRLDNPSGGSLRSLCANPLFVGAAQGNFALSSSSPAINAGDPANPANRTVVGLPDIGAFESGSTNTPIYPTTASAPTTRISPTQPASPTDRPGSATPTPTPSSMVVGDYTGDGKVTIVDFTLYMNYWFFQNFDKVDLNKDGKISVIDFTIFMNAWYESH